MPEEIIDTQADLIEDAHQFIIDVFPQVDEMSAAVVVGGIAQHVFLPAGRISFQRSFMFAVHLAHALLPLGMLQHQLFQRIFSITRYLQAVSYAGNRLRFLLLFWMPDVKYTYLHRVTHQFLYNVFYREVCVVSEFLLGIDLTEQDTLAAHFGFRPQRDSGYRFAGAFPVHVIEIFPGITLNVAG